MKNNSENHFFKSFIWVCFDHVCWPSDVILFVLKQFKQIYPQRFYVEHKGDCKVFCLKCTGCTKNVQGVPKNIGIQ